MAMHVEASTRIPAQSHLNSYVQTGSTGDHAKQLQDGQTSNWQKGEVVEGKILSTGENTVLLEVDGKVIEAKLEGNFNFMPGETLRLAVADTTLEKLLLKQVMDSQVMSDKRLEDILNQLGLKQTPANKAIVQELMGAKLALSTENLKGLQTMMIKYPQVNVRNMVLLLKNGIALTDANIKELMKTQNPEDMLANRLHEMISKLVQKNGQTNDMISRLAEGNHETEKILEYLNAMVQGKEHEESQGSTRLLRAFLSEAEIKELAVQIENLLRDLPKSKLVGSQVTGNSDDGNFSGREKVAELSGEAKMTAQTILTEIKQGILKDDIQSLQNILSKAQKLPAELKEGLRLLLSEKLTLGALRKGIFLNGKEEDPAAHLEKLFEKLGFAKKAEEHSSLRMKDFMQDVESAKDSMSFMAKFQNDAGFLQLPFFIGDKVRNGELFVLRNKKGKKEGEREEISALLQLDFSVLGHLDTFIKKEGQKLQIDFYVQDEEKETWMKEKVYLLHNALTDKNYHITAMNVFIKKEKTDGFADFLADEQVQKISRFSFDMRA